jgi:hypothetical protein
MLFHPMLLLVQAIDFTKIVYCKSRAFQGNH